MESLINIVRSTISMLKLGGLGVCPPGKILKNRCSEMESETIFTEYIVIASL